MKQKALLYLVAPLLAACSKTESPSGLPPAGERVSTPSSLESDLAVEEQLPPPESPTKSAQRPPAGEERRFPVAEPVPDMPGKVKSPFSGKIIDVSGFSPGTLVADPTFPPESKKHFRIPEGLAPAPRAVPNPAELHLPQDLPPPEPLEE